MNKFVKEVITPIFCTAALSMTNSFSFPSQTILTFFHQVVFNLPNQTDHLLERNLILTKEISPFYSYPWDFVWNETLWFIFLVFVQRKPGRGRYEDLVSNIS